MNNSADGNHALFGLVDQDVSVDWLFVVRMTALEAYFGGDRAIGLVNAETCRLKCQNSADQVCAGSAVHEILKG